MSVTANPRITFGVTEQIAVEGAGNLSLSYTQFDRPQQTYSATTSPAVSKVAVGKLALTGGTDTIDLTDAPRGIGGLTHDLSGLQVVTLLLANPGTNPITISPGASNPYPLFGSGNSLELLPGMRVSVDFVDGLPDVSGSAKTIDVVGTASDELWFELTAG